MVNTIVPKKPCTTPHSNGTTGNMVVIAPDATGVAYDYVYKLVYIISFKQLSKEKKKKKKNWQGHHFNNTIINLSYYFCIRLARFRV